MGLPSTEAGDAHVYNDGLPMWITKMLLFCTYSINHARSQLQANGLCDRASSLSDVSRENEATFKCTILFRAKVSNRSCRSGANTSGFHDVIALLLRLTLLSRVVLKNISTGRAPI